MIKELVMKTKPSNNKNHFTPLEAMHTESICLGILWTIGAIATVALLIFFGINEAKEIFQPIVEALQVHTPIK